jgi:hypothetical protein
MSLSDEPVKNDEMPGLQKKVLARIPLPRGADQSQADFAARPSFPALPNSVARLETNCQAEL